MEITTLRRRYQKEQAWGLLASIDLAGCDHELIQSPKAIKDFVARLIRQIKMKAYGPIHLKKFGAGSLEGYSAMQFIETSCISIHCDDKLGDRVFIDVFSCKFFDHRVAEKFAKSYFKAKKSRVNLLLRK
jgi:S-adenosylmethionine decarboxylase